jgi:hypothetical protein
MADQRVEVLLLVIRTLAVQVLLGEYITVLLAQYSGVGVFVLFLAIAVGWTLLSKYLLRWIPDSPAYSALVQISMTAVWVLPISYLQVALPPLVRAAAYSWVDLTVIVVLVLVIGSEVFFLTQSLLTSAKPNERGA